VVGQAGWLAKSLRFRPIQHQLIKNLDVSISQKFQGQDVESIRNFPDSIV
jgi:hypothetical protein